MHMVMFVMNNPDKLDEVLDGWHEAGIKGATIFESTGIYRRRPHLITARYAFGFPPFIENAEEGHYTLFTIVEDEEMVARCFDATEEIVGDLRQPHTGVMAAWPLARTKGAHAQFMDEENDE